MHGSSEWSLSLTFPTKILHAHMLSPIHATCPTHLILLDLINRKLFGGEYRSLISSLFSFLHFLATSALLGPNILLNTQFSNTLSLHSSLKFQLNAHNVVNIYLSPVTSYMFQCLLHHLQGDNCVACSKTVCFLQCCYIGWAIKCKISFCTIWLR